MQFNDNFIHVGTVYSHFYIMNFPCNFFKFSNCNKYIDFLLWIFTLKKLIKKIVKQLNQWLIITRFSAINLESDEVGQLVLSSKYKLITWSEFLKLKSVRRGSSFDFDDWFYYNNYCRITVNAWLRLLEKFN